MKMAKPAAEDGELEELRETFDYNDRNEDGKIGLDEFIAMLDELEAGMSAREARVGFNDIDTNNDGLIDFREFAAWWRED
jgi:Ca2+-binding EF-hand superfamily protein